MDNGVSPRTTVHTPEHGDGADKEVSIFDSKSSIHTLSNPVHFIEQPPLPPRASVSAVPLCRYRIINAPETLNYVGQSQ